MKKFSTSLDKNRSDVENLYLPLTDRNKKFKKVSLGN